MEIKIKLQGKELVTLLPDAVIADGKYMEFPKNALPTTGKACYGNGHFPLFEDFYGCVAEGKRFPIDGEEAAKVVKLILAIYKSQGGKVNI